MYRPLRAIFFLGLLTGLPAAPQESQEPPGARIRVSVNEVIVPVTVTDEKGRFVSNLEQKDFRILDEGRPQKIEFFSHNSKQQAIVVGFLVDLSNASRIHWKTYQDAMLELVWNLLPGDDTRYTGYLVTYSNEAEVAVNTTHDSDKIANVIRRMKPGGGSALYDAIYMACTNRSLVKGEPYEPRRVIVVVGDGHDNASKKSLEEVLELAKRNMATIYAISTQAFGFNNESQDTLERLTRETGGHVEYPLMSLYKNVSGYLSTPRDAGNYVYEAGTGGYAAEVAAGITQAIVGVSGDISTQYILRYVPDVGPDMKARVFRRIKVEVPELPSVTIRARDGYYPDAVPAGPVTGELRSPTPGNRPDKTKPDRPR